jgi:hypothetical protein
VVVHLAVGVIVGVGDVLGPRVLLHLVLGVALLLDDGGDEHLLLLVHVVVEDQRGLVGLEGEALHLGLSREEEDLQRVVLVVQGMLVYVAWLEILVFSIHLHDVLLLLLLQLLLARALQLQPQSHCQRVFVLH